MYVIPGEEGVCVMTIVDQEDDRVYDLIYAKELQLAREIPGARFDFSVIARRGRPIEQIMGQNRATWERPGVNGNPD